MDSNKETRKQNIYNNRTKDKKQIDIEKKLQNKQSKLRKKERKIIESDEIWEEWEEWENNN
jgi:hypothetical protein